ncbi:MAG: NAD(P)H-binding protein [Gemmatimonadetes bacterium]|nr:NAD(P)H-binding protein [Gemmatimonadota bacterium]
MYGTAFVAGATGYTGRALIGELRRLGVTTIAHIRPDSERLDGWHNEFGAAGALVDSTPWDENALARTLSAAAPTVVFALLGTTRARMRRSGGSDSYETVDYGLSAMLLRAVQRSVPHARFVYLSSAWVGPSARAAYLRVRWRFEEELRASGVAWTIARPMFITGSDRTEPRPLERAAAAVLDGALRIAGALGANGVQQRYATLSATELARGLAAYGLSAGGEGLVLGPEALRGAT